MAQESVDEKDGDDSDEGVTKKTNSSRVDTAYQISNKLRLVEFHGEAWDQIGVVMDTFGSSGRCPDRPSIDTMATHACIIDQ